MRKILLVSISAICLSFIGCKGSAKNYQVYFVDRSAVFAPDKKPSPLTLVVEIKQDGRLSLNKIETGRIDDVTDLTEKIVAIFEDREKAGIDMREVVIAPQGEVKSEALEKLIKSLAMTEATPILVIKNNS